MKYTRSAWGEFDSLRCCPSGDLCTSEFTLIEWLNKHTKMNTWKFMNTFEMLSTFERLEMSKAGKQGRKSRVIELSVYSKEWHNIELFSNDTKSRTGQSDQSTLKSDIGFVVFGSSFVCSSTTLTTWISQVSKVNYIILSFQFLF